MEEELTKTDTNMRRALSAEVKLASYLNLLAHGEHYYSISQRFAIGESTMSSIIPDVGKCLNRHLKTTYSNFLKSRKYIIEAEQRFRQEYTWPGVYGAIDGTLVKIPFKGDASICRKGYASINCLCVADADLRCSYYSIGHPGSSHDARVWSECDLLHSLTTGKCPAAMMEVEVCCILKIYIFH